MKKNKTDSGRVFWAVSPACHLPCKEPSGTIESSPEKMNYFTFSG